MQMKAITHNFLCIATKRDFLDLVPLRVCDLKRRFQKSHDLRRCGAVKAPLALWEPLIHNNWTPGEWDTQCD